MKNTICITEKNKNVPMFDERGFPIFDFTSIIPMPEVVPPKQDSPSKDKIILLSGRDISRSTTTN